ncbi:MAG: DNA helicase RecQ [Bacteroidales bacterium]|nr:DNA helicase RecQ [Bacteroidales bacterium]MBR5093049.1 DNA helicase RecQ [Bacteroidales bacterium]
MKDLHIYLKEIFGFDKFKGDQEAIIQSLLEGNDTFVIMPTGGGKSLCYQLPAMILDGTAVVVSPLIALMKNQVDAVRYTSGTTDVAHFLNSSLSRVQQNEVKEDLLKGGTKLLYVAPETLSKEETIELLKQIPISFFAIDEAHCISEWGHDFRPEYRRLREAIKNIRDNAPILTLTASATPKVQQDIIKNLGMENAKTFISSFNRPNLYYEVRPKPSDSMQLHKEIIRFIKENPNKSGIIYCLTRKKVEDLAELLVINGIKALPYHAGLETKVRTENQDKFLTEEVDVIVATIAFGMGIDKPDVRFVIHYDIPKSIEGYYQETGRAGRDGGEGRCIAFYSEQDVEKLYKFFSDKNASEQEMARQLVQEMVSYAESSACRRLNILRYFGEDYNEAYCGNCDNCTHPRPQVEAKEEMQLALETIVAMKQAFKPKDIVDVLLGHKNTNTKSYHLDKLEQFGSGSDHDELFWKAVLRQAIFEKLVQKEVEQYGVLKLTPAGNKFIKNPYTLYVTPDHDYTAAAEEDEEELMTAGGGASAAGDEALYVQLKSLRRSIATREKIPAYAIFEDTSLKDMTLQYPCSVEELSHCSGVGIAKAQKHGGPFIELIKKYVEDNDIERPQDIVIRSAANKSANKVYIIQSIDRRKSLEDIAAGKGLTMDELLTEMEHIISSGTKLNIDYHIEEQIEPEHQEVLMDYWHESESGSLEEAYEEFADDPDYTQEEIRLMRIKFLADVGH